MTRQVLCNQGVPSDYRLSPALAARMMGACIVLLAIVVFVMTLVVAAFDASIGVLAVAVFLVLLGIAAAGWYLTQRAYVVRLGADGYRVRLVRGAGVKQARWKDVEDAVTTTIHNQPCLVLRLRDGRTTTIPVAALAGNREAFVRDVQEHLNRGHGLRKLG